MTSKKSFTIKFFINNNPFGVGGFIYPIFYGNGSHWFQKFDKVTGEYGFEPYSPSFGKDELKNTFKVIENETETIEWSESEGKLFAFAFSYNDIVLGGKSKLSKILEDRYEELDNQPFLQLEVAGFLGKERDYLESVDKASESLKYNDPVIGESWRKFEYDKVRSDTFLGRRNEINKFKRFVESKSYNILNIHSDGAGGVGKTQLLKQFKAICENKGYIYTNILIDFYHSETRTKIDIFRSIAESISIKGSSMSLT